MDNLTVNKSAPIQVMDIFKPNKRQAITWPIINQDATHHILPILLRLIPGSLSFVPLDTVQSEMCAMGRMHNGLKSVLSFIYYSFNKTWMSTWYTHAVQVAILQKNDND